MSDTRTMTEDTMQLGDGGSYIQGDKDPANFSYTTAMTRAELLALFLRNPKVKKACAWFAGEIIRERLEFKKNQNITGQKHGTKTKFKFEEWLEWCGFWVEVLKALMWSLLFGDAILVFYDGKEKLEENKYKKSKGAYHLAGKNYIKCKAFYQLCKGNGYTPMDVDEYFGIPNTYKIELHAFKASKKSIYFIDKARVVRFPAPQLELKYSGTSTVSTIAKDCLVQEQIKRSVSTTANMLSGGIMAIKAATKDEKERVKASIGDSLSHLRRIYFKDPKELEFLIKLIIPDIKVDQVEKLFNLLQKDITTGIDMSQSNLEGAPQGAISSAEYDSFNTYAKVKFLQSHYKKPFEECFFLLGKKDTTFEWMDPTPKIGKELSNEKENGNDEKIDKKDKEKNKEEEKENVGTTTTTK